MTDQEWVLHNTYTRRLSPEEGEGWEFTCAVCGYWARYMIDDELLGPGMTIFNLGDPQARHTSSDWEREFLDTIQDFEGSSMHSADLHAEFDDPNFPSFIESSENDIPPIADEDWLTPEIRSRIEEILRRHGF